MRLGRLGSPHGLYVNIRLNGVALCALIDTGSTASLVRPGILPGTEAPSPRGWSLTKKYITTATGERSRMKGWRVLDVEVESQKSQHMFWLAKIQDPCIIGLDLLAVWGGIIDVTSATLRVGHKAVQLHSQCQERVRQVNAPTMSEDHSRAPQRPLDDLVGTEEAHAEPPSEETRQAVRELCLQSCGGLGQEQSERLQGLLEAYIDIFAAKDEECTRTNLVQHNIDTGETRPIRLRPHRLPFSRRAVAEKKIEEMLKADVIEPSNSPWAAPVVLVGKKDKDWRFCVDYRRLNENTRKDSYPLPRIDDTLDYIAGSSWFSSLDLRSGYWQVELSPEARPKTAFTIGQGLWQFKVMPFGLCNAPATFERLMEKVLARIPRSRCVVYLDDLLVHADSFETALANLQEVFDAIRQANLRLHPRKCHLLRRETTFLGHVISAAGVSTDPDKVSTVRDWPEPRDTKELRSFLGLASYYRRFVKDFATLASPLHRLTQKGQTFHWDEDCATAFSALRMALVGAPVLQYPDPNQPFILDTDASDRGIGAVLSQGGDTEERVVAYYSRTLSRAERNYCVTRRELLAVVQGVRHFRHYLYGRKFLLRTDHASLTWLLNFKEPEGQLARWLEALQDYNFQIVHRAGRLHGNADALSRRPCAIGTDCKQCQRVEGGGSMDPQTVALQVVSNNPQHPRCFRVTEGSMDGVEVMGAEQLREEQDRDSVLARVRQWVEAGQRPTWEVIAALDPETKALYSQWSTICCHSGLLYRQWQAPAAQRNVLQLLVPKQLRAKVLQMVHGSVGAGHFGVAKTLQRLRSRFHWPGCRQDVELHVHCCDACTAKKGPTQRSHAPLQQYQVGAPMERVGVDVLGPFPVTERGNRYILVAMDYFTKWPEAYAIPDQSAATTAERLVSEMFCRFGAPEELHSDQGRNFEAEVFGEVCRRLGIKKTRTTPLHPQSDGLVERFNRTLSTQLAILVDKQQHDWDLHLPVILWAYRTAVQESTHCTPALLMFGHELRTPVDLVFGPPPGAEQPVGPGPSYICDLKQRLQVAHELARECLTAAGLKQKRAYDSRCQGKNFEPGDKVWVFCPERKKGLSPKLTSQWAGPSVVIHRLSDVVYRVRLRKRGRLVVLHRDRLAPYQPGKPAVGELETDPPPVVSPTPQVVQGEFRRAHPRQQCLPARFRDFIVNP